MTHIIIINIGRCISPNDNNAWHRYTLPNSIGLVEIVASALLECDRNTQANIVRVNHRKRLFTWKNVQSLKDLCHIASNVRSLRDSATDIVPCEREFFLVVAGEHNVSYVIWDELYASAKRKPFVWNNNMPSTLLRLAVNKTIRTMVAVYACVVQTTRLARWLGRKYHQRFRKGAAPPHTGDSASLEIVNK